MSTEASGPAERRGADRAPRSIPVRRPTFDFAQLGSAHWFGGDPFLTHLLNALSLTFPEGERFFMDSVKHYQGRVASDALRHEIVRFLGQESLHARAHEDYNAWLSVTGVDPSYPQQRVKEGLERIRRMRSPRYRLAMTCALEHFTAMMAEMCLEDESFRELMDPEMRRLLVWHAIEETEHKAVAFDTYVTTGGSYRMRVAAMLITTFAFVFVTARFQEHLMRQDPDAAGAGVRLRGLTRLWIYPGWFRRLVPLYVDYFRRDFHPWDRPAPQQMEVLKADLADAVVRP